MQKPISWLITLSAVAFLMTAFAALAASFAPFLYVKQLVDSFAMSGSARFFQEHFFNALVLRLRFFAAGAVIASLVLFATTYHLTQWFTAAFSEFKGIIEDILQQLTNWITHETLFHQLSLGIIFFAGIIVRLYFLATAPLRPDEAYTFSWYASKPLWLSLVNYTFPNNHFFHTILVHLCFLVGGNIPWVIRFPAFVAGIAMIALVYALGRRMFCANTALLASALVTSSSILIDYSANARGYTLLTDFFLVGLCIVVGIKQARWRAQGLCMAAVMTLGFFTVPTMLYAFAIIIAWQALLICFQPDHRVKDFAQLFFVITMTLSLTMLVYAPAIAISGIDSFLTAKNNYLFPLSFDGFIGFIKLLALQWSQDMPRVLAWALFFGLCAYFVLNKKVVLRLIPLIAIVLGCYPIMFWQKVIPFERVFLFLLPVFLLLVSDGLCRVYFRWLRGKYAVLVWGVIVLSFTIYSINCVWKSDSIFLSKTQGCFPDAKDIATFLKVRLKSFDKVLTTSTSNAPLYYYCKQQGLPVQCLLLATECNEHVWVVVNNVNSETFSQISGAPHHQLDSCNYGAPQLFRQFEHASIFLVEKIK